MKKEKPKYLYKYLPINRHTLNLILSNEAYFSLPVEFNDPFDCDIIPEIVYTAEEHKKFIGDLKAEGKISHKEYMDLLENPTKIIEQGWKETNDNIKNLRMFCLSTVNNNVMMYSHYADSHKGICLEFLVSDDPFFDTLHYVRYTEMIPIFHPFYEDINLIREELMEIELFTKSFSWCYEKEWRIIKDGPVPSMHKFSPIVLSSIIFGYRAPPDDKLLIERVIDKRVPSIQLKEAVKKEKSFDLEIRPYR